MPLGAPALLVALQGYPWGWICHAVGQDTWSHDIIP